MTVTTEDLIKMQSRCKVNSPLQFLGGFLSERELQEAVYQMFVTLFHLYLKRL